MLNICTPGGLDQFFREASALIQAARQQQPAGQQGLPSTLTEDLVELAQQYGVSYD